MKRYLLLLITLLVGAVGLHADTYKRVTSLDEINTTDTYLLTTIYSGKMYVASAFGSKAITAQEFGSYSAYPNKIELAPSANTYHEYQFPAYGTYHLLKDITANPNAYYGGAGSTDVTSRTAEPTSTMTQYQMTVLAANKVTATGRFMIQSVSANSSNRALFFNNGVNLKNYGTGNLTEADNGSYTSITIYKKVADDTREAVSLTLDAPAELNVGETGKATVTATPAVTGFTFTSSDETVATIAADGTITALGAGETTITASYAGDAAHQPATTSATLRVIKPIDGNGFTIEFLSGNNTSSLTTGSKASTFVASGEEYLAANPVAAISNTVMYKNANYLQFASGSKAGSLTLKLNKEYIITAISINARGLKAGNVLTVNGEEYSFTTDYTDVEHSFTSTTPTDQIVMSALSGKQVGVQSITIYFMEGTAEDFTDAPEFSVEQGEVEAGEKVALTCATEGASIYYTTDGSAPTAESTLYTAPITISETVTIKAIAVKEGLKNSPVVTATYTVVPAYATLAEFIAAAPTTAAILNCPLTVTYFSTKGNLYVTDGTTATQLYRVNSGDWKNGSTIEAGIRGTWNAQYNEIMIEAESLKAGAEGAPVAPKTVKEVTTAMVNEFVEILNVDVVAASGSNFTATDADKNQTNIYNTFGVEIEAGKYLALRGIVSIYQGNAQITLTEAVPVPPTAVAALTVSPAFGDIVEGTSFTVSCETEGATLSGTIGDLTLTDEALPYTYALTEAIDSKIAVSLKATKEGLTDSELLEGEYTVVARPTVEQTSATFNFADLSNVVSSTTINSSGETSFNDQTLTNGNVALEFTQTSSSTGTKLWEQTQNKGFHLRMYNGSSVTVKSTTTTGSLDQIVINYDNTNYLSLATGQPGTLVTNSKVGTWTPATAAAVASRAGEDKVSSVTFTTSATSQIANISATYTDVTTGISTVEVIENAPVVYYNLQGVRVVNPAKGQLLIRVQGNTVTKVIL